MKWKQFINTFLTLTILCYLSSCSLTKSVPNHASVLRKNTIDFNAKQSFVSKNEMQYSINGLIKQQPNTFLFGIFPYKVWLYNLRSESYQNDSTNFQIKSKTVEAPVIYDEHKTALSTQNIKQYLFNDGYFDAQVNATSSTKSKKTIVKYEININSTYFVNEVQYITEDSNLLSNLKHAWINNSLIKKNARFSNNLLAAERNNMVEIARNNGYYKFNLDDIHYEIDTLSTDSLHRKIVNINVLLDAIEPVDFQKYTINKIYYYPNDIKNLDDKDWSETKVMEDFIIRYKANDPAPYVHYNTIIDKTFLRPGKVYAQNDYNLTLRQLNDLNVFKYVRVFLRPSSSAPDKLNCHILMAPAEKYDLSTNFEVTGGDLYVAGSAINVAFKNNNLFKNANQFKTSLTYGIELDQDNNKDKSFIDRFYLLSQNIGWNFSVTFPRLTPFSQQTWIKKEALPKSILSGGISRMGRTGYFTLNNINLKYGFQWKPSVYETWTFSPVFFNSLKVLNVSDTFQQMLDNIPAIRNSYQENFIEGEQLEYIFNNEGRFKNRKTFARIAFEEAGGILTGIHTLTDKGFNFNFARYVRLDFDVRKYHFNNKHSFNYRVAGGVGLPYGPNQTLPYIKQFFVGGPYSIRGWGPRQLGPGSYFNPNSQNTNERLFVDQSGDIKLELNTEYRFNVIKLFSGAIGLSGAIFVDGGNIWLSHKDTALPGAEFRLKHLYKEMALSTGAGIRADLGGLLILRADWAFPVKKPYVQSNNGWVFDEINFNDKAWRRNNINLNIAIGYPF